MHIKTAFNALAYKMGQEYVLRSQFDDIRRAIVNNSVAFLLSNNTDKDIEKWVGERSESEAHFIVFRCREDALYAYISFYGEMIYMAKMANDIFDEISFAYVCDWKNRKDYVVEIDKTFWV